MLPPVAKLLSLGAVGLVSVVAAGLAAIDRAAAQEPPTSLVYAVWGHGQQQLYTANEDGSHERHIPTGRTAMWPDLSPDGQRIVYQTPGKGVSGSGHLVVMRRDGASPHVVAANGMYATWSRDGTEIAYFSPGKGIYVVHPDGSHRRLVVKGRHVFFSAWMPSGEIAYVCRFTPLTVCAASLDGDRRRLTGLVGSVPGVTFSPDGSLAAYYSGTGRIYLMNADGTHRRVLYSGVDSKNGDCGLAWAPDSKRIAFSPVRQGRLYKINVATRKVTRLGGTMTGACGVTWR